MSEQVSVLTAIECPLVDNKLVLVRISTPSMMPEIWCGRGIGWHDIADISYAYYEAYNTEEEAREDAKRFCQYPPNSKETLDRD